MKTQTKNDNRQLDNLSRYFDKLAWEYMTKSLKLNKEQIAEEFKHALDRNVK